VSDGIARDLHRLCGESGVGARIEGGALPFAAGFAALCGALGADPDELALAGGEDYVLLFTLPKGVDPPARFGCRHIGSITERRRVLITARGGAATRPLRARGWDHLNG
jgi:thiamine-monophosphate kinase